MEGLIIFEVGNVLILGRWDRVLILFELGNGLILGG